MVIQKSVETLLNDSTASLMVYLAAKGLLHTVLFLVLLGSAWEGREVAPKFNKILPFTITLPVSNAISSSTENRVLMAFFCCKAARIVSGKLCLPLQPVDKAAKESQSP